MNEMTPHDEMHTSITGFSRMSEEYENEKAKIEIKESQKRLQMRHERKFISP